MSDRARRLLLDAVNCLAAACSGLLDDKDMSEVFTQHPGAHTQLQSARYSLRRVAEILREEGKR